MNSTPIPAATGLGAIRGLGYVFILCDDFERMKAFYTDVFGFPVEEETPGTMIEFWVGGVFLGLSTRGRSYNGPSVPQDSASLQLSLRVPPADVDAA
ncbi:MAG: VOC family protein [Pseudomonadota bacterium]